MPESAPLDPAAGHVLSYDVPEPTMYAGKNFIELGYDKSYFQPHLFKPAADPEPARKAIEALLGTAASAPAPSPAPSGSSSMSASRPESSSASSQPAQPSRARAGGYRADVITRAAPGGPRIESSASILDQFKAAGLRATMKRGLSGRLEVAPLPKLGEPKPVFLIVETQHLSTYAGAYGVGRVLKTMTLLPGEKTTISLKTYQRSEDKRAESSSILDSFTEESAEEFETSLQEEQASQESKEKSRDYYLDGEAHAQWGWGSADVSAGASGSSNEARTESAKCVSEATAKHSAKASSKREVQVNTSTEATRASGEETSIVREIQNLNLGRTLNFTFRQMNQEFLTFLHLTDMRIAVFNGHPGSRDEAPLSRLDELIARHVVDDAAKRAKVKADILAVVQSIYDWHGERITDFVVEKTYPEAGHPHPSKRWVVNRDRVSTYQDPVTKRTITLPGVVLNVSRNIMRTEGVMVEPLLGQAPALDGYSLGLQELALKEKQQKLELAGLLAERERLGQRLLSQGNHAGAESFARMFAGGNGSDGA